VNMRVAPIDLIGATLVDETENSLPFLFMAVSEAEACTVKQMAITAARHTSQRHGHKLTATGGQQHPEISHRVRQGYVFCPWPCRGE